jgi:3-dehydroquinate synthase
MGPILEARVPADRYAVITDSNVAALYGKQLVQELGGAPRCLLFQFPPGEPSKTRETWATLTDEMLARRLGRDTAIIALGGGVTGDLAGFVAGTYLRGVPYVQVPTSILAMVDSSIGGKTGIDTAHGKNLVGVFHQPQAVVIDLTTINSLPTRHISAGAAEALKHGAICDAEYFDWLVSNHRGVLARNSEALFHLVRRSVELKGKVVTDDERELGRRAILNFGHTIAHALESVSSFEMLHGETVGVGMLAAANLGIELGITDPSASQRLNTALDMLNLPTRLPSSVDPERMLAAMTHDKKNRGGSVRFALLKSIGQAAPGPRGTWTHTAPDSTLRSVLARLM